MHQANYIRLYESLHHIYKCYWIYTFMFTNFWMERCSTHLYIYDF